MPTAEQQNKISEEPNRKKQNIRTFEQPLAEQINMIEQCLLSKEDKNDGEFQF